MIPQFTRPFMIMPINNVKKRGLTSTNFEMNVLSWDSSVTTVMGYVLGLISWRRKQ
jgi:hypothetical protein